MVRRIRVDRAFPNLVPGRMLRVTDVVLEDLPGGGGSRSGGGSVRVEYEIAPPLPERGGGGTIAAWPVVWDWRATDDVGTDYEQAGGGYGPRGDRTDGELTVGPLPPPAARTLRVVLRPWFPWADAEETFRECAVEIDLTAPHDDSEGAGRRIAEETPSVTAQKRVSWLIPEERRGWVEVRFGAAPIADCPPLVVSEHAVVIRVPPSGELCTSTPLSAVSGAPHIFMRIPAGPGAASQMGRLTEAPEWVTHLTTTETSIRFYVDVADDVEAVPPG